MYKTIRHGENSLQYTILPQNDDFRLEGKIKSAGGSKKLKTKKPKRRSFFAYLGLLFVCTVIVGAVLVPFLVSAECLPNPTEWFLKTKAAFSNHGTEGPKEKQSPPSVMHAGNALANSMINKGNVAKANLGKSVKIIHKDGVEKIVLKVNKEPSNQTDPSSKDNENESKSSTVKKEMPDGLPEKLKNLNSAEEINSVKDLNEMQNDGEDQKIIINQNFPEKDKDIKTQSSENDLKPEIPNPLNPKDLIAPTTLGPLSVLTLNRTLSSASVPNVPRASLQSSLSQSTSSGINNNNSSVSTSQPTITTRIMQVPLLKATAKKPPVPPVLVKTFITQAPTTTTTYTTTTTTTTTTTAALDNFHEISNLNDIIPIKAQTAQKETKKDGSNSDWIHSHWPYIDPSTYFQWNGYKTEDSVLLPALLGFALIGVILIITVCLVARNKRTIVTSVRKRNRNDIEETGAEDNTTLLTNTNLSDED